MSTIKVNYKIIYNRRNTLDRNGKASVVIEAYQSGKRKYFETGVRLFPSEWDASRNEVKKKPALNRLLRDRVDELETFELTFSAQHKRPFTLSDFNLLQNEEAEVDEKDQSFTSFALNQIERDKADGSINSITYGRYVRVIDLLAKFSNKHFVSFKDFDYSFIDRFHYYLLTVQSIKLNTAYKHHQVVQKYLSIAIKRGLFESKHNPYNDFRPKKSPVETIALSPAEITKIENLVLEGDKAHLVICRDAFLLSYYTLLRIGDITRLSDANFTETDKGIVLDQKAQKTGKANQLPLYILHQNKQGESKPELIVRKYMNGTKKPFFNRSHPKLNEHIKAITRLAGIKKEGKITFHTARHSGITFLSTVMATPIVQLLAQHSSIATTMGYVHISRQDINQSLEKVIW